MNLLDEIKVRKDLRKFRNEVTNCQGSLSVGTRYATGAEWQHGMWEGSPSCSCGHRSHFVSYGDEADNFRGKIFPGCGEMEQFRRDWVAKNYPVPDGGFR